jgi:hypothetical protein
MVIKIFGLLSKTHVLIQDTVAEQYGENSKVVDLKKILLTQ